MKKISQVETEMRTIIYQIHHILFSRTKRAYHDNNSFFKKEKTHVNYKHKLCTMYRCVHTTH